MTALPTFVGIGAQKAGTTSLSSFLKAHPEVHIPEIKEMHFFDFLSGPEHAIDTRIADDIRRRHLRMEAALKATPPKSAALAQCVAEIRSIVARHAVGRDREAYRSMLTDIPPGQNARICGEITPSYATLSPDEFRKIATTLERPKILFLMRNPVDRLLSQVDMTRTTRARRQDKKADPMVYMKRRGFVQRSRYEITLKRLDKVFPPEDVFIAYFEDLYGPGAQAEHRRLCAFLGISDAPVAGIAPGPVFTPKAIDPEDRLELVKAFEETYRTLAASPYALPASWQEDLALL